MWLKGQQEGCVNVVFFQCNMYVQRFKSRKHTFQRSPASSWASPESVDSRSSSPPSLPSPPGVHATNPGCCKPDKIKHCSTSSLHQYVAVISSWCFYTHTLLKKNTLFFLNKLQEWQIHSSLVFNFCKDGYFLSATTSFQQYSLCVPLLGEELKQNAVSAQSSGAAEEQVQCSPTHPPRPPAALWDTVFLCFDVREEHTALQHYNDSRLARPYCAPQYQKKGKGKKKTSDLQAENICKAELYVLIL